jgi:glycosyltransferase involved in cell wall biosynthesis
MQGKVEFLSEMKVLFVHDRFGSLAGAEANVIISGSEFKGRGHQVAILHGPGTGRGEESWSKTFENRHPLNGDKRRSVNEALEKFQPDIIYVHKMPDLEVIQALVDSKRALVRMVHDHDIYCMRGYKYSYFTRKICRRPAGLHCLVPCGAFVGRNPNGGFPLRWVSYLAKKKEIALNRQFHRMVVVSNYMRDELLQNGFHPERIEIHPPVPRPGDPLLRSSFGERNLIIYAGQIIRGKGVDLLLRSLARVKTPFECVILGDGGHKAYCEALSRKLKLTDRVHFKGFIPQEELKQYYREATVMPISSVWPEPYATIGMEVMRYGIPVVAFDVGGLSDWLKDGFNGFLVPVGDCAAFAARLEKLLLDKALARRLGEQGLDYVTESHDFDTYIGDLEEMFSKVLTQA